MKNYYTRGITYVVEDKETGAILFRKKKEAFKLAEETRYKIEFTEKEFDSLFEDFEDLKTLFKKEDIK